MNMIRSVKNAKGSNLTVVMNVPQNYDVVVNKITNYAAKHSQINFFDYHDGNLIYDKKPVHNRRSGKPDVKCKCDVD